MMLAEDRRWDAKDRVSVIKFLRKLKNSCDALGVAKGAAVYSQYPIMSGGRCRSSLRFTGVFNKPRSIRLVCETSPPRVYCIFARC